MKNKPRSNIPIAKMFVSARVRFRRGDARWDEYIQSVSVPQLSEVRSIDSALNHYVQKFGDIECTPATVDGMVEALPTPQPPNEYYLLAINLDAEYRDYAPAGWQLLGHDLCDETETSSLLNCGPWNGRLKQFTARLNAVGLLSRSDAESAQIVLALEWGAGMDHADVDIWALYERESIG